jgi:hypothetical protein
MRQFGWFLGLYMLSIMGLGLFYVFEHLLIHYLS